MSHTQALLRRTGRIAVLTTALSLALAGGFASTASATGSNGSLSQPQQISKADANLGGANGQCPGGPYCSTRSGLPSMNGNGNGNAVGKPAAGAVGKADNKNPKGQMPNGSDHNAGYECDTNHGIGRSNPAHTGCTSTPSVVTPSVVKPPVVKPPVVKPPVVKPPVVKPPVVAPAVVAPSVLGVEAEAPVGVLGVEAEAPVDVLGVEAEAPVGVLGVEAEAPVDVLGVEAEATNPLPAAAAAGETDTNGQLAVGGFAAFAALLALGARFVLRRRNGVV